MEALCDLLFEFSSIERMSIMKTLLQEHLKLSHISKNLDMTITETSRHLQRLSDIQLIQKEMDGAFAPTPLGELALSLFSSFEFISNHKEYFLEHNILALPSELVNRIGDLSNTELNTDVVRVLAHVNTMFQEAEEYIWVMSYSHSLPSTIPIVEERLEKGVTLQRIFPMDIIPPTGEAETISGPCRTLPKVDARIMMTEKEAMCSLPSIDGKTDYSSFVGVDSKFHKWCSDLYNYYWERASPAVV